MSESILLPAALGCAWGVVVNAFLHFMTWRALNKPKGKVSKLVFVLRQVIVVTAIGVTYRSVPMLIGTACGMLAVKNYILINNLIGLIIYNRKG